MVLGEGLIDDLVDEIGISHQVIHLLDELCLHVVETIPYLNELIYSFWIIGVESLVLVAFGRL